MPRADLRIFGGTVVTMDPERKVISDGAVAVVGSEIAAVGERGPIERDWTGGRDVDVRGGIVIPGLINCHAHSLQILLRGGIGAGRELYDWLLNVMYPGLAACTRRDAQVAAETFCVEAIRGGTTTVVDNGDAGLDPEIAAGTLAGFQRLGLRVLYCPLYIEEIPRGMRTSLARLYDGDGPLPADVMGPLVPSDVALAQTRELRDRYDEGPTGAIQVGFAPALPQTTSEEGLARAAELAEQEDALLTIHVAQGRVDRRVRGRSAIEYLRDVGALSPQLLAAHCVWVSERDAELLAGHGARVAHNPTSNLFLSAGIAPVGMLRQAGVTVGLGTDDANSNNAVDVFGDMKLAALLPRVRNAAAPVSAADAFAMATVDAATAIGLGSVVGSIEPGKQADLVVVDAATAELVPVHDVYETLVFQHAARAVDTTIVGGQVLMTGGRLAGLEEAERSELLAETQHRSSELVRRARLDAPAPGVLG